MDCDILEEMPQEAIDYFCEQVLKRDWPNSILAYYFIKTGLKWNNTNSASTYKLYYLSNDIENGTFIGIYSQPDQYPDVIVVYTCPGNEKQFQRVLRNTKFIDWQKKPLFQAVLERISGIVESTIQEKGMKSRMYVDCVLKWMPADEAAKLEVKVPEEVCIGQLNKDHVDFIYSHWGHSDVYSKFDIWDTIMLNFGLGVFNRHSNDLLAWAMNGSYGGLSTLIVTPESRRRGFGKLIAKAITKEMGKRGITPYAIIGQLNITSLEIFKSIGYDTISEPVIYFIVEEPRMDHGIDSANH
ncbi:uncharacterized protein LOC126843929 [Adelges cooleyi]|uniref:uncharacterized protein LOC126843929 n=1 Tax=Adelges cooleyi TaxID=133065 RepID=UPI0021803857|nr:uncharacterized protein LOC126843929 [Adelges cooleyi]